MNGPMEWWLPCAGKLGRPRLREGQSVQRTSRTQLEPASLIGSKYSVDEQQGKTSHEAVSNCYDIPQ